MQANNEIAAEILMISGCKDDQLSKDVQDISKFSLPDPNGKTGGALTSALLGVAYADRQNTRDSLSFQETLLKVRGKLQSFGYEQIPQLSSSRPLAISRTFDLVPRGFRGTRRAVMIGINYTGQKGALRGCHNDVANMKEYLLNVHDFDDRNIVILLDDGKARPPTRSNIMDSLEKTASESLPGDVVFLHFAGHGARVRDRSGDEADQFDEAIAPVDYRERGLIKDDALLKKFILKLKSGVFATCIFDCCNSGTVLDLPYTFAARTDVVNDFIGMGKLIQQQREIEKSPESPECRNDTDSGI